MSAKPLTLEWLPGLYAVCRVDVGGCARNGPAGDDGACGRGVKAAATVALPVWARIEEAIDPAAPLLGVLRTEHELTVVIAESRIPADAPVRIERGFSAMRVVGTLDFSLVGVLSTITGALAAAGVPVFALSTFDTDVILVREADRRRATEALERQSIVVR